MKKSLHYDEPQLVELLRQRKREGFVFLYENYSASLFGVILRLVKDSTIAEDVLQEVFINIYRKFDTYTTKYRLYTWMNMIARNLSIDTLKSKNYRNASQNNDISFVADSNQFRTLSETDHIGLQAFCMKLRPKHWEVIELRYFYGYVHSEIALILDIPLGTVKTRLKAGLLTLRGMMRENDSFY